MHKDSNQPDIQENTDHELLYRNNREVFYHFHPDHGFSERSDYQNPSNQVIIKQSWDAASERLEAVRQQMLAGKASPVAYYMEKILMEVPMLADYMDLPKWRVRRHMKQSVFRKLKPELVEQYARVFGVTIDKLMKPDTDDKT